MKRIAVAVLAAVIMLSGCSKIEDAVPTTEAAIKVVTPESDYVRTTLTDAEKANYKLLYDAVYAFEPSVSFPDKPDKDEMKKLFVLLYNQESRIFWLSSLFTPAGDGVLKLSYRFDDTKNSVIRIALEAAAGKIISELPNNSSDYDKIKLFHDKIVSSCSFSKDTDYANTAYGALVNGYAQCEGYAFAFSYLCDEVGLENYVVTGTNSEGASHAWNKVCADGSWYNVDCTWDDPILKHDDLDFIQHDYLLVPDALIEGKTHFPDNSYVPPIKCESEEDNYYYKENLIFSTAAEGIGAMQSLMKAASRNNKEIEIRFDNTDAYNEAYTLLFDNNEINALISSINSKYGLKIRSAYKYTSLNLGIIHLSLIYDE